MSVVAVDASDAYALPLRGWGRYASRLLGALPGAADGLSLVPVCRRGVGPELLWEQIGLPRAARRTRAAVLHSPNCFLPLRRSCPGVLTIHDLAFEAHPADFGPLTRAKFRSLVPAAARSAERIICVSRFSAADVERRYAIAPERIRVIAPAPALPQSAGARPPRSDQKDRWRIRGPYLLGVGDLRAKKDFVTLVRAWRSLRQEGLPHRLVLAGLDCGEGPRLRAEAGAEPLELTGYVDDRALDELLTGADALVHPSRYEGFGLVLVEAMARGTPVIAARAGALPETGGPAALYFSAGDAPELAQHVREATQDASVRAQLVAAGRRRAGALTWEATARATVGVYRELLS